MATWYLQTRNQQASKGRGRAHAMYIAGIGRYADKDEVIFVEDYNLPAWAEDACVFFENADKNERANGRSFRSIVFAIPFEVSDTIGWTKAVAQEIAGDHAYRLAIHDKAGNPHAHIQMSERTNSPTLPPEKYFGRGNPKNRAMNGKAWLDGIKKIYERAIKMVAPNFTRPTGGKYLKVGPKLKRAGKKYELARQERIKDNARLKQLETEFALVSEELAEIPKLGGLRIVELPSGAVQQDQVQQGWGRRLKKR